MWQNRRCFSLSGMRKGFLSRLSAEHQQELTKQIENITIDHDKFKQTQTEQTTEPHHHHLVKQIDEWESQSIDKIHRGAADELCNVVSYYRIKVIDEGEGVDKTVGENEDYGERLGR